MIILFVNIKLLIDSCLSKGFPCQLHEALRKCIGKILALVRKRGSVGRVRRRLRQIVLSLNVTVSTIPTHSDGLVRRIECIVIYAASLTPIMTTKLTRNTVYVSEDKNTL